MASKYHDLRAVFCGAFSGDIRSCRRVATRSNGAGRGGVVVENLQARIRVRISCSKNVKWRKPVFPGDVLMVEMELMKARGKNRQKPGASARSAVEIVSEGGNHLQCCATHDSFFQPVIPSEIHRSVRACEIGPIVSSANMSRSAMVCKLHSHIVIDGHTQLGRKNEIFPFASIGLKTQDLKWKGGVTRTEIGDGNTFREYVTVHSATAKAKVTRVGSDQSHLGYCHIAHKRDARQSRHHVQTSRRSRDHVTVEDYAVIGGLGGRSINFAASGRCPSPAAVKSRAGRSRRSCWPTAIRPETRTVNKSHGTHARFRGGAGPR